MVANPSRDSTSVISLWDTVYIIKEWNAYGEMCFKGVLDSITNFSITLRGLVYLTHAMRSICWHYTMCIFFVLKGVLTTFALDTSTTL